jgi:hypothetical protein
MKTCPKCKQKTEKEHCDACAIVFADYERDKRNQTGKVYQLISAGELEQAKTLAQNLSIEFPDSKGDFILLISNINRDLNITKKYQQAKDLLNQGQYDEATVLLRNIKAFDPGLEEKIITLRRRVERYKHSQDKLQEAVDHFEHKRYSQAKKLFLNIGEQHPDAQKYLKKIDTILERRIQEIQEALTRHLFNTARDKATALVKLFPEISQEHPALFKLLDRRKEINERLIAAAHKAKEEKRHLEAKVLYFFLIWQNHELKPLLFPYIEEIGEKPVLTLADCSSSNEFNSLGFLLNEEGFLQPLPKDGEAVDKPEENEKPRQHIAPVATTPESLADTINEPVYIDGEELADFTS